MFNKYKAIFFDFGRVIANYDNLEIAKPLSDKTGGVISPEEVCDRVIFAHFENTYGKGGDFHIFHSNVESILKIDISEEELQTIWKKSILCNKKTEEQKKELLHIFEKISSNVNLFILSNTDETHWSVMEEMEITKKYLKDDFQQILSFRVGSKKPEKEIFEEALRRALEIGVNPDECIYIDDVKEYVMAFSKMGPTPIHFDNSIMEYSELEKKFLELGVLK